ncbi:MAG: sensor domain-containing phosphodiesterase [Clostridia bacterium]|nr:sensor domain-containing phosphodiesterase [Clostridia bacterium]
MNFSILDNIDIAAFVIDIDTHDLIYVNKFGMDTAFQNDNTHQNPKCYKYIFGNNTPCEFCSTKNLSEKSSSIWEHYNDKTDSYCYILDKLVMHGGKLVKLSLLIDIADIDNNFQNVLTNLQAEQSMIKCVKTLTSAGDIDTSIRSVLSNILSYYDADRVSIFEIDWESGTVSNTYESCSDGTESKINEYGEIPLCIMDFWIQQFKQKKYISIGTSQEETDTEKKQFLLNQNLEALLAIPFYYNETVFGFLSVENPRKHHANIKYLRNLAYFISNEMLKHRIHQKNEYLSYHDTLTGLYNRNYYNAFRTEFKQRKPRNTGVVFVDVNELKYINDTYGHECGDKELIHVAHVIKKNFPRDIIFRISGDEFVVICEEIPQEKFLARIESMLSDFYHEEQETVTCGSYWTESYINLDMAVNKADELLYVNKQEYRKNKKRCSDRRPHMLQQLIQDIKDGKYMVYLQPISHSTDESVYYAEALIRYQDGNNVISPANFIPNLEKGYIISNIDYFVLEEVCKKLKDWLERGKKDMRIAINFSKITLMEESFFEKVTSICRKHDTDVRKLVFEMPETTDTLDRPQMNALVQRLCAAGFGVALDDFGKKYSSIDMLMSIDMDTLKLDRNIISQICSSEKNKIIVQYIIDIAHNIGMKCVAEGVETKEQQKLLKDMRCDYIQGYVLGRPIAISEFEDTYLSN